jgi:hypothetical protein
MLNSPAGIDAPLSIFTSIVFELILVTENIPVGQGDRQDIPELGSLISGGKVNFINPLLGISCPKLI